jgi:nucleotide-binding universal stress UspA family protein
MTTILAATDFSEGGNHAVFYAAALADAAGANLMLVHAYKAQSSSVTLFKGINEVLEQDAKSALEDLKKAVLQQFGELTVATHAAFGDAPAVLAHLVKDMEVGLVVTGTRGKSLLDTLFFGSTSSQLCGECATPLLLVPPKATFVSNGQLSYATALRESPNPSLLQQFQTYAQWWRSHWRLVHVYGDDRQLSPEQEAHFQSWKTALQLTPENSRMLYRDDILEGLLEHLEVEKPLVLAIHRHHYGFLERFFVPSVGEALARKVKMPMLVLPQQ